MITVWKYQLEAEDEQAIEMPVGAEILWFGYQNGTCCIWARVNTTSDLENRHFSVRGTGALNATGKYRGTAFFPNGLVFHLFEPMRHRV
jgi:hypothetical protein